MNTSFRFLLAFTSEFVQPFPGDFVEFFGVLELEPVCTVYDLWNINGSVTPAT